MQNKFICLDEQGFGKRRIAALIMSLVLTVSTLTTAPTMVKSYAFDSASMSANADDDLQTLVRKSAQLKENADAVQASIDDIDSELSEKTKLMNELTTSVCNSQNEISELRTEVAESQQKYAEIIKASYISGNISGLEVLLSEDGAANKLNTQQLLTDINKSDSEVIEKLRTQKESLNDKEQNIERLQYDIQKTAKQTIKLKEKKEKEEEVSETITKALSTYSDAIKQKVQTNRSAIYELKDSISNYGSIINEYVNYDCTPNLSNVCYRSYNGGINPYHVSLPNCTTYAWGRVYETSGIAMPHLAGGSGNANGWYNGYGSRYPTSDTPIAGSILCWNGGRYGHVAFVEKVNSDGTVTFSESGASLAARYGSNVIVRTMSMSQIRSYVGSFRGFVVPTKD